MRLTLLVFALFACSAQAQVIYKCVAGDGKVTYSESPCYGENWHRMGTRENTKPAAKVAATASPPAPAKSAPKSETELRRSVKLPTPP